MLSSKKEKILTGAILLAMAASPAFAELEMGGTSGNNTAVFGGFDIGFSTLSVEKRTQEVNKSGVALGFKGLGSFYFESPWVVDAGLGWSYTSLSGTSAGVTEKNSLRNGFLEFSPRYRSGKWQFGPVLDLGFGADLTLSQPYRDDKTVGLYPGVQVLHEISGEENLYRIGGRATTDMSIPDRSLWTVQLSLQFGIPTPAPKKYDKPVEQPISLSAAEPLRVEEDLSQIPPASDIDKEIQVKQIGNMVQVELSRQITNFKTNSAELSPKAKEFLNRLGSYLATHPGDFTTVGVEGHTDVRGTLQYNMKLSRRRALSAKKALVVGGVPKDRFELLGFGPKVPVDARNNARAWAKNRRVEVRIDGTIDPARMMREIEGIKGEVARRYPRVPGRAKKSTVLGSSQKRERNPISEGIRN